jgi:hypothetical protein
MSLRKSPTRTPAFLAANRANALRSTGPRTYSGKLRSSANAFKNGSRSADLRQRLLKSGRRDAVACYDRIYTAICARFRPASPAAWKLAERRARSAWSTVWCGIAVDPRRWVAARRARKPGEPVRVHPLDRIRARDGRRLALWLVERGGSRWVRACESWGWPKPARTRPAAPPPRSTARTAGAVASLFPATVDRVREGVQTNP